MYEDSQEFERKSKSQLKREMHELQGLGERLLTLSKEQLAQLDLPEQLCDAVALAKNINARGGKRRQLQYIGKLMRDIDPEPLQTFFAKLDGQHHQTIAELHVMESWRERLLADNREALTAYLAEFPQADSQKLRQLIKAAQQERDKGQPKGAARALFKYLRDIYSYSE